jgi:hypothetical protein
LRVTGKASQNRRNLDREISTEKLIEAQRQYAGRQASRDASLKESKPEGVKEERLKSASMVWTKQS